MAAYIFQTLAQKGKIEGIDASIRQRDTRTWFRDTAQKVKTVNRNKMMNDKENVHNKLEMSSIGKMYMYFYDPKHKANLPYYDTFPLVFPINFYNDGFLGINLHYLPPILRAKLMDTLYKTATDNKFSDNTKLQVSYQILSNASRYKYFEPCLKRYLFTHVQSGYLNIPPRMWDAALMLPSQKFVKASAETVWRNSRRMTN